MTVTVAKAVAVAVAVAVRDGGIRDSGTDCDSGKGEREGFNRAAP